MDGHPVLAVMDVETIEEVSDEQMAFMTEKVYRTSDREHPGVATFNSQGRFAVSGAIQVLHFSYFQDDFPDTFRTAVEIRHEIAERGWQRVVAFQTRNPMHLAHEELCHMAMDRLNCDGLVIHMLLGKLKPGDIPAPGARRLHPQDGRTVLRAEQRHGHRLRLRHALCGSARGRAARLLPPEHGRHPLHHRSRPCGRG